MIALVSVIFFGGLSGCDRNAKGLVPVASDQFPGVLELGELEAVDPDTLNTFIAKQQGTLAYIVPNLEDSVGDPKWDSTDPELDGLTGQERYDKRVEETGMLPYYFGQLGQPEDGGRGGATFTFMGTGDDVCIVVDPETPKRVESERMKTKSRNCIFEGVSLTGEVETTIVAGMVYETD